MALAAQTAVSDGSLTTLQVGIDFIDQDDIFVYLDLTSAALVEGVDYTWTASDTITLAEPVPSGVTVYLLRRTQLEQMLNVFDGGAGFSRETLDENFRQILLLAQEMREGVGLQGVYLPLDMNGNRIINMGAAEQRSDAVTYGQVQDADAAIEQGYTSADASLQAQLTGDIPVLASAFSPISWHAQVIGNSVDIPANVNAWSFGPSMAIGEGATITVGEGSFWTVANGQTVGEGTLSATYPEVDDAGVLP